MPLPEIEGLAIGELDFTHGGLVDGTYDQWTHTDVFPTMYKAMTGGKLSLSCAHGFQAITRTALEAVLPFTETLIQETEQATGAPLTWGFDSVMALSCHRCRHRHRYESHTG